ncbi:MAG: hypothetical protein ACYTDT_11090 [Planctomycetota bacterium]|jgi:hypothetical protein
MQEEPTGILKHFHNVWVQAALIAVLAFVGTLYYQYLPGYNDDGQLEAQGYGLSGADGYYHIKMGYLYRTGEVPAAGGDFHWTQNSIWKDEFSDKDYLFHVFLMPFTLMADGPADDDGLVHAAKLAQAVIVTLLMLTLFGVLRVYRVRGAWFFTLALIVVGASYMVFRLNLCRSYLFSIIFAMVGWVLLEKRARLPLVFLAAMYTLSYTASHLLLAMLVIRSIMDLIIGAHEGSTRKKDLIQNATLAGCIVGGIAIGCLLHPESWTLVKLWWIQNVVVLAMSHQDSFGKALDSIGAVVGIESNLQEAADLDLGSELKPTKGPTAVFSTPLVFFGPMLLPLFAAALRWRPDRTSMQIAAIAVTWYVLYLVNGRFIEYAAPFMTIAIAVWITRLAQTDGYKEWKEAHKVTAKAAPTAAFVLALVAACLIWFGASSNYVVRNRGDIREAGQWIHQNEQAHGKIIWHDRWDDFTELMFYASEADYLTGLDPTFMYVHDADKFNSWNRIRRGKEHNPLKSIRDDFNADYILVHKSSSEFLYNKLSDEAKGGRLFLEISADDGSWSLYRIAR